MKTFDIEVLKNYTLFAFMNKSGDVSIIEIKGKRSTLTKKDRTELETHLKSATIVTFNGIKYDMVVTAGAIAGLTAFELYQLSQNIIVDKAMYWNLYRGRIKELKYVDHIDLIEPAPAVNTGLKLYGARLFSKKLWDTPVDWNNKVSKKEMKELVKYCGNDLQLTWDLYNRIKPSIDLREQMGKRYDEELRSKSDAQVAEAVIIGEIGNAPKPRVPSSILYTAPKFIKFKTPELIRLAQNLENADFKINKMNGKPIAPEWLKDTVIQLGEARFQVGLGGLHSMESSLTVVSDKKNVMRNADVASFYPRIIINSKLFPPHLGDKFLEVYNGIVETRLKAKASGDKETAESLKITINGSFGKFGSKYSKLYASHLLLAVTFTGQLSLLMLIEGLERAGIRVVSANTDGVEYFCPRKRVQEALKIISNWEKVTGYTMENDEYVSLHARDVNNYIAKYKDHVKSKGSYKRIDDMPILKKNPQVPICYTAIRDFIEHGTKIEKTIHKCKDVAQFLSARQVNGGASYDGELIGKVVRWYYNRSGKSMHYLKANKTGNFNKVPLTDDCKPMMDLAKKIPKDLDYDYYIGYAIKQHNLLGGEQYESLQAVAKKAKK